MNSLGLLLTYLGVLTLLAYPLGIYMARVFEGRSLGFMNFLKPLERLFYRTSGIDETQEMNGKGWVSALLIFSVVKIVLVFFILFFQNFLPGNPQNFPGVPWDLALNTAVSFVTNTNWQNYGGEYTLSYVSQMVALAVQNFLSAAAGIMVLLALIRGIARKQGKTLGNFWVDMVRTTLYILLPLSMVYGLFLISQGVIQNFNGYVEVQTLAGGSQLIPGGPAASQIAIKLLGTNGGGFFNANSAFPLENPNPFSNFTQIIALTLIAAGLVFAYGRMVGDKRQSWAIYGVMVGLYATMTVLAYSAEVQIPAQPLVSGVDWSQGNMEGKETRFGIGPSVLFATATTSTSCGAVNSMHDSYTPLGGMVPMVLMQFGEVVFGGVGSGLYGMLAMIFLTVFVGGLMVGRTPEYLGKKVEPFDMKMVVIATMITPLVVLLGAGAAALWPDTAKSLTNPGPHGFSEMLYAFTSTGNNNGSAFGGFSGNTNFLNVALALTMFFGRFGVIVPIIFLADSLVQKKTMAQGPGTLPTHGMTFNLLLVGFIIIVAALNYIPALALGPLADFFQGMK